MIALSTSQYRLLKRIRAATDEGRGFPLAGYDGKPGRVLKTMRFVEERPGTPWFGTTPPVFISDAGRAELARVEGSL